MIKLKSAVCSLFKHPLTWVALIALVALSGAWIISIDIQKDRVILRDCEMIFGVEHPTPEISAAEYRSRKIAAGLVLARLQEKARQNAGATPELQHAFEVYESCFDPDRMTPTPARF